MATEIEARYRAATPDPLTRLAVLDRLGRFTLASTHTSRIVDTYLDTAGCDLAQLGWACRLRSDERGWTVTLKGPNQTEGAVVSRPEYETLLPGPSHNPQHWPDGPWRDQVLALIGKQPLTPWMTIRQTRDRRIVAEDSHSVAELSLDTVDLAEHGPRLYMVECELLPEGRAEDMAHIAAVLRALPGLVIEPRSKLELAVATEAAALDAAASKTEEEAAEQPAPPCAEPPAAAEPRAKAPAPRPEDSIWVGGAKVLERYRNAMLEHEPGTRLGEDPEELHDMRVATRRMRSALRLLRPYLLATHASVCESGLRRLALMLGAVRDLDVAIGNLAAYGDQAGDRAAGLQLLLGAWTAERDVARIALLRYLDRKRYQRLLRDLETLLSELYAPREGLGRNYYVSELVPRLVHVHWQSVEAHGQVAPGAPIELLHQVRIECKRLRYALEGYREALPKRLTKSIPSITALQDHLGELHDAAVAVERIDRFVATRGDVRGLEGVLAYRESCRARMEELERSFPEAWAKFQRTHARRDTAYRSSSDPAHAPRRRWTWPAWLRRTSRP